MSFDLLHSTSSRLISPLSCQVTTSLHATLSEERTALSLDYYIIRLRRVAPLRMWPLWLGTFELVLTVITGL